MLLACPLLALYSWILPSLGLSVLICNVEIKNYFSTDSARFLRRLDGMVYGNMIMKILRGYIYKEYAIKEIKEDGYQGNILLSVLDLLCLIFSWPPS